MDDSNIQGLIMPKWGLSMSQGTIVEWLVGEGDVIVPGSDVVEVETEKITGAVEAPVGGLFRRRVAQVGQSVPVSGLLGVIAKADVSDEAIDRFVDAHCARFVPQQDETDSAGPAAQRVEVAGRSIRYLKRGEGAEPLLLLHGFGGDLNSWLFNHEALAATHTVYALDLPGHGESSKDVGDGTIGWLAEIVSGFLSAVEQPQVHLVGHSLGGAVVLQLALSRPDQVRSCTLIAAAALGAEIDAEFIDGFVRANRRKEIKPQIEKLFADSSLVNRRLVDDVLKYKRIDGVDQALRTIAEKFIKDGRQATILRDQLSKLSAPSFVIWGAEDRIIPVSHTDGLPSHQLAIVEKGGHMVHMERANDVNRIIEDFIIR